MSKRTKRFIVAAIAGGLVYFIGQESLVAAIAIATFVIVIVILVRTKSMSQKDDF